MLVRLLLAVLTAAGPVPVGACTCAVAGASEPEPTSAPVVAPVKTCGCKAHAADDSDRHPADRATPPRRCCEMPAEQPARHDHHDRECPAANPRPAVVAVAVTPADDLTTDTGPAPAVTSDAPAITRPTRTVSPDPAPPPLPLYLSLCSLRI